MNGGARGGINYPLGCKGNQGETRPGLPATSKRSLDPRALDAPLSAIRGVGRATEKKFHALGVHNVGDLLLYLPFRHEPPSKVVKVAALVPGEECVLRVRVISCATRETARRGLKVLEALVCDESGSVVAVWYNQAYLEGLFRDHPELLLKGMLVRRRGFTSFVVRRHEILDERGESRHVLGLIPVYSSTGELSVRTIRSSVHEAASYARHLVDPLPAGLLAARRYPGKAEAVLACHFPRGLREAKQARERLAFEELLLLQIALLEQRRAKSERRRARPLAPPARLTQHFLAHLPYQPTAAQLRVIGEIDADLAGSTPMCRLLHGDVGSGKTTVAAYCLLRAVEQGAQGALMAPTEVLADQHYLRLTQQLEPLGVRVGLLKGSQPPKLRKEVREALESGEIDLVVGTHALIQEGVRFKDLRVAVVDEQHRFGVKQREAILTAADQAGYWPHTLHMSATPIPRTLSLTLYGDLDVSVLDELPKGRKPVVTRLVFAHSEARMWQFVREKLKQGRQAYVVCPLIEESEALQTASACRTFAELSQGELRGFRVELLHGQLSPAEKAQAMGAFASGRANVLVCTSIIEVGVDVSNATVMVIMGARRFGLSQLHQLRGRVARSEEESYCFLLMEGEDTAVLERLELFARTTDGFALAEADLRFRGEGQLFGERQSGLGDLEIASLIRDRHLLEEARAEAEKLITHGLPRGITHGLPRSTSQQGPLESAVIAWLREMARQRFGAKIEWMERV